MNLTYKYRLSPTQAEAQTFLMWFDHLCDLQNSARFNRVRAYEEEGVFVSRKEQQKLLTQARRKYADYREVPQDFQNHILARVDKAFGNFRRRCKNGDAKKGSHRWQKAVHATALHQERTTHKRKDFIGKLVYKLYHHLKNNVLVAEDLGISNMVQNTHLSKSISDASWGKFFKWCADIAERDGLHFHQVNPKDTSQTCSCCGLKSPKKLSLAIRTFNCGYCGFSLDRDQNAALNILIRAATALRGERWVATLCETRNKNEAENLDLQKATQLTLFSAIAGFPSL